MRKKSRPPGNRRGPKWNGPPGLSAAEKKAWSEKQRRSRQGRTLELREQERRREQRRDPNKAADRKRERRFRFQAAAPTSESLSVVSGLATPLYFLDEQGRVQREDTRSAKQLIAEWLQEKKQTE